MRATKITDGTFHPPWKAFLIEIESWHHNLQSLSACALILALMMATAAPALAAGPLGHGH